LLGFFFFVDVVVVVVGGIELSGVVTRCFLAFARLRAKRTPYRRAFLAPQPLRLPRTALINGSEGVGEGEELLDEAGTPLLLLFQVLRVGVEEDGIFKDGDGLLYKETRAASQ